MIIKSASLERSVLCLCRDGRGEPKSLHSADYDTARGRGSGAGTSAHHHHHGSGSQGAPSGTLAGPNHGQYATLSKQCKTLESNDFYWEESTRPDSPVLVPVEQHHENEISRLEETAIQGQKEDQEEETLYMVTELWSAIFFL